MHVTIPDTEATHHKTVVSTITRLLTACRVRERWHPTLSSSDSSDCGESSDCNSDVDAS